MKVLIAIVSVLFLETGWLLASGTLVETWTEQGFPKKVSIAWTSPATNASAPTPGVVSVNSNTTKCLRGEILRAVFTSTASAMPSNNYDVYLYDEQGIDVLAGLGVDVQTNVNRSVFPGVMRNAGGSGSNAVPFVVNETLQLVVTNCQPSKSGTVIIYLK